jgi:type VI secretion system protein
MATHARGSLFERLGGETARRSGLAQEAALTASVASHLSKMLSTRAGSVQTLPDYGLPDFNDINKSAHDVLLSSRAAIESFIRRYEPRLSAVSVNLAANNQTPLKLGLRIEATLAADGNRYPVAFLAQLSASGEVVVEQSHYQLN